VALGRAGFYCDVHLLNGNGPVEFGHAAFQLRCPDLWKNDDGPIRLKEELEPVSRFEVQVFAHQFWDGRLVFAAKGGFHKELASSFTFYQK
jgi:hypothetical protein